MNEFISDNKKLDKNRHRRVEKDRCTGDLKKK